MHLTILSKKVNSLQQELDKTFKEGKNIDDRIKKNLDGLNTINENRIGRAKELAARYEAEINDYKSQIKLAEEVLGKKKEERQALLMYLQSLDLNGRSFDDLRNFDWDSLRKIAEDIHKPSEELVELQSKADILDESVQTAKQNLNELSDVLTSTTIVKERLTKALGELRRHVNEWTKITTLQEKRISKTQSDNERLNILIRQCIANNEPMSEYITENVQAKCQAFVNSDNSQELLNGLRKFKSRQERIIKLLQYKENKLSSENNKLEVAKDQTHDQVKFYLNLIGDKRLNSARATVHRSDLQTSMVN